MNQVGKLDRVLDEEHRDVVPDQVPVALLRIELDREAAHVARRVDGACAPRNRREAGEDGRPFPLALEQVRLGELRNWSCALEVSMRGRTAGMDDAFRYALVIEVENLFAQHEIFEHRGPARAGLQRVLIIGDADSLVGGQVTDAAVRARPRDALMRFAAVTGFGRKRLSSVAALLFSVAVFLFCRLGFLAIGDSCSGRASSVTQSPRYVGAGRHNLSVKVSGSAVTFFMPASRPQQAHACVKVAADPCRDRRPHPRRKCVWPRRRADGASRVA